LPWGKRGNDDVRTSEGGGGEKKGKKRSAGYDVLRTGGGSFVRVGGRKEGEKRREKEGGIELHLGGRDKERALNHPPKKKGEPE